MGSSEELFAAIEAGDVRTIRSLVAADPGVATARDADGVSALMRAPYRFDPASTEAIISAVPQLDVFEAATFGELDRLTAVRHGDPSAVMSFSGDGYIPLHLAAFFSKPEAAALLVARGAEVDARGRGWMSGTPLHSAASAGQAEVAAILLDAGADPDTRQTQGWTPLHAAARNADLALVELLLARGADAASTNDDGATALDLADEAGDAQVVDRIRAALEDR